MKVHYIKDSQSGRVCMCQLDGTLYIVSHSLSDGCWTVRPVCDSPDDGETVSAEVASQILRELSKETSPRFPR